MASDVRRLNLGSGPNPVRGWTGVDRVGYGQMFTWDIGKTPWPFGVDAFFDGIVANHSLQCLTAHEILPALKECRRVLQPHAVLRILVPNVVKAFTAYLDGNAEWAGFAAIGEGWDLDRKFAHYMTWGGQNRSCFTSSSLTEWLLDAGFDTIVVPNDGSTYGPAWQTDLDSRLDESLIVEAM